MLTSRGRVFLSCVSSEFRELRTRLAEHLRRFDFDVKVQEDFFQSTVGTMEKVEDYVRSCRVVVHVVGAMPGA
ncbi:MAG TPA: DUF4062 domain-containing protein, partial [Polyangia bacterium]|nr:DUF4062 domain-containing protein [Polyangia bacterium]